MKIPFGLVALLLATVSFSRAEPSWEITNPLPLPGEVISIDVPAPDTVWAANDGGLLVRSTDDGRTWNVIDLPITVTGKLLLDFTSGNRGFVSAISSSTAPFGAHVFRTANGGNNWTSWEIGNQNAPFGATCLKVYGETALVGGINPGITDQAVVYRLNNNNWDVSFLPGDDVRTLNSMAILNQNMAWAVGDNGYVASTSDGGRNWQQIPTQLETDLFCVYYSSPTAGWVGGGTFNTANLYKTTNGGTVWQRINGLSAGSKFIDLHSFGGSGAVAVSRGGGEPDSAHLYYSTNGRDWSISSIWGRTFLADVSVNGGNIWVSGTNGLIARSVNGAPAEAVSSNCTTNDLVDISFATGAVGWAVGELGTVLKTFNAGRSWEIVDNFPYYEPIAVMAITPWRVIVCCRGSIELLTSNGGESWREIEISNESVTDLDRSEQTLFAIAGNAVSVSRDNGANWSANTVREGGTVLSITAINDTTAFASLLRDSVFVTFDAGENWTPSLAIPPRTQVLTFLNENISYAAVETQNGSNIYATEDGWLHSERLHSLGFYVSDLAYFSIDSGYVLGNGGQFQLLNRGNAAGVASGLRASNVVNQIEALDSWIWICGEGGLIARYGENWLDVTDSNPDFKPNSLELMTIWPNPTNGRINIRLESNRSRQMQIIGIDGRQALSFVLPAGYATANLDLRELRSGVYFVRDNENYLTPKALLLLK